MSEDIPSPPKRGYSDSAAAAEIAHWIEAVVGDKVSASSPEALIDALKDGTILCRVANAVEPRSVPRFKASSMPFVQMENIAAFLRAASHLGVPDDELFETVDLFEARDPVQVFTTIRSYSRCANKHNSSIPVLGPQIAAKNTAPRVFKPVEIPAWNTFQYGFMNGANQSTEGVVVGRRRDITLPETATKPKPPPRPHNILVPSRPPKPAGLSTIKKKQPRANVFGDEEEKKDESANKVPSGKLKSRIGTVNAQLMAYSLQSRSQVEKLSAENDASIYAYDEVYDSIQAAREKKKEKVQTEEPMYMEKLLESKRLRERDRQRAMDVKLRRERENNAEEFADKESFVTSAYKKQQEEIAQQLLQDEKDEKKIDRSTGLKSMYKTYLNSRDDELTFDKKEHQESTKDNKDEPADVHLAAGLNLVNKPSGKSLSNSARKRSGSDDNFDSSDYDNHYNRNKSRRHKNSYDRAAETRDFEQMLEKRAETVSLKAAQAVNEKREQALATYRSGSSSGAASKIEAARQRLLERKKKEK